MVAALLLRPGDIVRRCVDEVPRSVEEQPSHGHVSNVDTTYSFNNRSLGARVPPRIAQ